MNPFTPFLGRLVELLGAEQAAQLVREFAGQTLHFPATDHYGFPTEAPVLGSEYKPSVRAPRLPHTPLSIDEAIEISQRLLATVRQCCATPQLAPLPDVGSQVKDESCTAHPDQCTTPQCTPVAVQPNTEQEAHTLLASQPMSLSVPQSILGS